MSNNINVRIVGTANMQRMVAPFAELKAEVTALNKQLLAMVSLQGKLDPRGYEQMARAQTYNSKTMRSAAASTGMFEVQQLRVNKATDDYITKLQKQKLTMRDVVSGLRNQNSMYKKALTDQVRMQNMLARTSTTGTTHGKVTVDTYIPNAISKNAITTSKNLAFLGEHLKSAGTQMVNFGKNTQWAGRQLSMGLTMPVAALGAAAAVMAYQVDQALTRVTKVYNTTAQSGIAQQKELDAVRKAGVATAMEAAKQYGQSATDTLNTQAQLAAAGRTGIDLQKQTIEVMRISRLGELDYNDAIKATISMQSIWHMSNKQLADSFNYINAVENQTSLETSDFVKAIPIAAAPVKAFGGNIQELGTLLVAMKSHGIEAAQGANAIKAAMQRLGRPSAQVQSEWTALTHTDITKIFSDAHGLLDLFSRINDATAQLSQKDKIKAFAGLFGTYQVTRMMSMVQGMQDLKDGVGQVTTAYDLAGQSQDKWATIAEQEIDRYKNSISGKWDRAFQEIKLQLASLGKPFVEVATVIISTLSNVIELFNKMPKAAKMLFVVPIALAAIAGPVLMLVGLFGNLIGTGIKLSGTILKMLVPSMEIMTTQQKAGAMAAEQAASAYQVEAEAADLVTMHLKQMTAAQALANKETRRARVVALMTNNPGMEKKTAKAQIKAQDQRIAASMGMGGLVPASSTVANNTKKMSRYAKLSAGSFALSAAAMGVMAFSSNETVNKIAEMVMLLGMMGPLIIPLGGKLVAGFTAARVAAAGAEGATASMAAGGAAFAGTMGTAALATGGVALAVGAVVGGFMLVHKLNADARKKQEELYKKQVGANNALVQTSAHFAENLGKAAGSYDSIMKGGMMNSRMVDLSGAPSTNKTYQSYQYYKNNSQGQADLKNLSDQQDKLKQQYLDFMVVGKLSAKQARDAIQGMLLAMGKSGTEAYMIAQKLYKTLGDIKNLNWAGAVRNSGKILQGQLQDTLNSVGGAQGAGTKMNPEAGMYLVDWEKEKEKYAKALAGIKTQVAETTGVFLTAWNKALNPKQAHAAMRAFINAALSEFNNQFQKMMANPLLAKLLSGKGIVDAKGLAKAFDTGQLTLDELSKAQGGKVPGQAGYFNPQEMYTGLQMAQMFEKTMVSSAAEAGHLGNNISDVNNLLYAASKNAKGLTFEQGKTAIKEMLGQLRQAQLNASMKTNPIDAAAANQDIKRIKNETLAAINALNDSKGFDRGKTVAQAWANYMHQVKTEADGLKNTLMTMPTQLSITLNKKEMIQTVHDAMSATQDDMVASAQTNFNSQWDSRMAAEQAMWDKRGQALQNRQANASDALQKRQQAAQDAMDKRFQKAQDAINKKYDDRVEHINKVIKAEQDADAQRQKMYEAEKKRLQDLADMANKNIDFNSALNQGNFDEAAKIRNDMQAQSAANSLDAIEARRAAAVQKTVDRLQKKIDRLGKMRDKELKRLSNIEDAQKKHLQAMQDGQTKALERSQKAEQDALKKREDADMASQQKTRDYEEAMLNQRLDLFKTYVAKNQKDLERWMRKVGLTYNDFGSDIKAKGESWASYFQKALHDHIIAGASQITSDKMWESITPKLAKKLLAGLGFKSLAAFQKFVNTGRLTQDQRQGASDHHGPGGHTTRHGGGMVGSPFGRNNRQGLRGIGGALHRSEEMVRAQSGEFIVNKKAAAKNRSALEYMNNGHGGHKDIGYGGASILPMVGYPAALMAQGFMAGTEAATNRAMRRYRKAAAAASSPSATGISSGFVAGPGGKHRPVPAGIGLVRGIHDAYTGYPAVDIATPMNTPAYAVANGTITKSAAITSGGSPGNGMYSIPYRSYGNVVYLKTDGGPTVLYAHLNKRMVRAGQHVTGGSRIGLTGNTGNSTGPHLHFGDSDGNPYEFLRKGGTVKFDNTPAMLHRGETVLTDRLTKQFKDNVAYGGGSTYNVDVDVHGSDLDPNDIANAVIRKIERSDRRGPTSRRNT